MRTVSAERRIDAPPERVFDLITDHAGYGRFRGIRGAELLSEGDPPPNGVGGMRRVLVGPFRFDEEITVYERPSRMDYLIVQERIWALALGRGFRRVLEDVDRILTSSSA